jgi:hypothetical protein
MDDKPKRWWWNRRWGRIARRDIKIFPDGDATYRVEVWIGGVEGRVRTYDDLDESAALALAEDLAIDGRETLADWRDMVAAR